MKKTFAGMIKRSGDNDKDIAQLYLHIQKMTDDLTRVIERGLSISDNLPMTIVTDTVRSNQPTELNTNAFVVRGAIPIETDGVIIKGYSVKSLPKGSVQVILDMEPTTAKIKFILIGD